MYGEFIMRETVEGAGISIGGHFLTNLRYTGDMMLFAATVNAVNVEVCKNCL